MTTAKLKVTLYKPKMPKEHQISFYADRVHGFYDLVDFTVTDNKSLAAISGVSDNVSDDLYQIDFSGQFDFSDYSVEIVTDY